MNEAAIFDFSLWWPDNLKHFSFFKKNWSGSDKILLLPLSYDLMLQLKLCLSWDAVKLEEKHMVHRCREGPAAQLVW